MILPGDFTAIPSAIVCASGVSTHLPACLDKYIVGAPLAKVEATKGYGAEVVLKGGVYDEASAEAVRLQKETGATLVHAFDDPAVIAGQGTIGLEILEQCPDIRSIVVPIGGGGLLAGIATAVKSVAPHVKSMN